MGPRRLSARVGMAGDDDTRTVRVGKGVPRGGGEKTPLRSASAPGAGLGGKEGAGSRNPWKRNVLSALRVMPNEVPPLGESLSPSSVASGPQACGAEGCVVCLPLPASRSSPYEAERVLMGDFRSRYFDVIRGSIHKTRA